MIAALLKFHHGRTIIAFPPTSLFSDLDKFLHRRIFGTFSRLVCFGITDRTGLAATLGTFADLATVFVGVYVFGLYPFATALFGTVYLVLGSILLQFSIPFLLEVIAKQGVDVLQVDFRLVATSGWHMGRIFDGKSKQPFEAAVAHAMGAW